MTYPLPVFLADCGHWTPYEESEFEVGNASPARLISLCGDCRRRVHEDAERLQQTAALKAKQKAKRHQREGNE